MFAPRPALREARSRSTLNAQSLDGTLARRYTSAHRRRPVLPAYTQETIGAALNGGCGLATAAAATDAAPARYYWSATRLLGVYEFAFPESVLIAAISSPFGETNMAKVGAPVPSTA